MRTLLASRGMLLALAAAGLALIGFMQSRENPAPLAVYGARSAPPPGKPAAATDKASLGLALPTREALAPAPNGNPFTSANWAPPPPPPPPRPKPAPPPPPTAPALPYSFLGLLEDHAKPTAFLTAGDRLLVVAAGDQVDGAYRIDAVSAKEIVLTYLPLNQRQSIPTTGGQ